MKLFRMIPVFLLAMFHCSAFAASSLETSSFEVTFLEATFFEVRSFENTLQEIKRHYHVPGMSVVVASGGVNKPMTFPVEFYDGFLSMESLSIESALAESVSKEQAPGQETKSVDKNTYFPIASLTKVFSSFTALQLAANNQLHLNDPLSKWLPGANVPKHLQVKHLLSHNLIGKESETFFYDQRFYWLTEIIAKSSDQDFESVLFESIDKDLGVKGILPYTEHAISSLSGLSSVAVGHEFNQSSHPIPHDFGLSASAGLMATPRQIAHVGAGLIKSAKEGSKLHPFDHHFSQLPYANGLFRHRITGQQIYWGYGQYDGFAALWLMVPDLELQLVMLANNNVLSDASRLILGDVTTHPVANAFVEHFLCSREDCRDNVSKQFADLHRHVYFSRYEQRSYNAAIALLDDSNLFELQTNSPTSKSLHLLNLSQYLYVVSQRLNYKFPGYDTQIAALINANQEQLKRNPYWLYYTGGFYDRTGQDQKAHKAFSNLVQIHNMPSHWTVQEAKAYLKALSTKVD